MSDRMTKARLKAKLDSVNDAFGFEREPYARTESGIRGNDGTFTLDFAYGGVRVCRICGPGTGETDLSGRGSMRDAYAYLDALETATRIMRGQRK